MNQHTMNLESIHSSGEQEWFCPTCQRRFLLQLPPNYSKTILVPGDETVTHTGGTAGLQVGELALTQKAENTPPLAAPDIEENIPGTEPTELSPSLQKWLKDAGLDKLI